jgi:VanZ family protein
MTPDRNARRLFVFLLLAHACFVIYGSLVPFRFHFIPLDQAWAAFQDIVLAPPRVFSRANLLSNILIGIPGPFLFLAAFDFRQNRPGSMPLLLCALAWSTALAACAEFLQLYFPGRMTTLGDILAQTLGGAVGVLAWLGIGPYTRSTVKTLVFGGEKIHAGTFLFWCYLGLLILIHALPLDLSLRLGPLHRQLGDGRIILVPFSAWTNAEAVVSSLPALLAWIPAGWFLVRMKSWPVALAATAAAVGAAALEFMQIFVLSRTTDVTAVLLGGAGGLIGGLLAIQGGSPGKPGRPGFSPSLLRRALLGAGLFLGWFGLIVTAFWSPFAFCFDRAFLAKRIRDIGLIPLQLYVGKGYLLSAYNILEVVVFFAPLGVIFSSLVTRHLQGQGARAATMLFFLFACLLAGLIEFGQVFIPQRYPDLTDWMLMVAGAMLGHAAGCLVWKKQTTRP